MTTNTELPTHEGIQRYEPDGYYTANGYPVPCTCRETCLLACKGECGCRACDMAFQDFGYSD